MRVMSLPQVLSKVDAVLDTVDIANASNASVRKELDQNLDKLILEKFLVEINDHVATAIRNAKAGVAADDLAASSLTEMSNSVVYSTSCAPTASVLTTTSTALSIEEGDNIHISVIDTDEGALTANDDLNGIAPPKKRGRRRAAPTASLAAVSSYDAPLLEQPPYENASLGDGLQESLDDAVDLPSSNRRGACIHGKAFRSKCAICRDCGHGRVKDQCVICSDCGHGKRKVHCKICCSCEHGKLKQHCLICTSCPHGMKKRYCNVCSGCPHGLLKVMCPQCDGCIHGKRRVDCRECVNCGHKKLKHDCKICSDCGHGKLRRKCSECREMDGKELALPSSVEGEAGAKRPRKRKMLPTTGLYSSSAEDLVVCVTSGAANEEMEVASAEQAVSYSTLASLAAAEPVYPLNAILLNLKSCPHGKAKKSCCAQCNDCGHGKLKSKCPICSDCSHGKTKAHCSICNGCVHGKRKSNCKMCSDCGHGKTKSKCSLCSNRIA